MPRTRKTTDATTTTKATKATRATKATKVSGKQLPAAAADEYVSRVADDVIDHIAHAGPRPAQALPPGATFYFIGDASDQPGESSHRAAAIEPGVLVLSSIEQGGPFETSCRNIGNYFATIEQATQAAQAALAALG